MGDRKPMASLSMPWSQQRRKQEPSNDVPAEGSETDVTHEQLKEYETRRRLAYKTKYDSMSLYWKSYRDLLSASLQETSRAQRVVRGTCRAHQAYADAMKAVHEDVFLDEKGNVMPEKQRKKMGPARRNRQQQAGKNSVMKEINDSQQTLAERFGENSQNMDEEIAAAIGTLLEDLNHQYTSVEKLGSTILSELDKTNSEVTTAWGKYLAKSGLNSPANPTSRFSSSPQETAPGAENVDAWIVEMRYRVAVAYQNVAWEKGSAELDLLFAKVNKEEIQRRMNLREYLVAFVQRQQRLFLSLPDVQNSVLEDLVGKKLSREEIEQSVQATIEAQAANYQAASGGASDKDLQLESPLTSDSLSKAKVVERRPAVGPGAGDWTVSLAVMTADAFVHFFDLEGSNVSPSMTSEEALKALMPKLVVPTAENVMMGKSNFAKGWNDSLTPADSLVLAKCSLQVLEDDRFELLEKGGIPIGTPKMFGKPLQKRVQIRTHTKGEADDWIAVLTS